MDVPSTGVSKSPLTVPAPVENGDRWIPLSRKSRPRVGVPLVILCISVPHHATCEMFTVSGDRGLLIVCETADGGATWNVNKDRTLPSHFHELPALTAVPRADESEAA